MSRIISYPYDDSIKAKDAWVGTDEASRQTKQYTAEALAEYLNISGSISIIGQMTYKYGTTPLNGIGTLAVFGGGPDIVAFSAVVKLTLSNQDISNQRVVEFLDLLVGSDILIAEQGAISTFGYYSIDSYATNATDSNYYDLGVTFKSGNGSMRSDRIYEAQNFVLANDATQSPWNTVPDGISYTAANVGIGTVTPSEKLEVSGGIIGDTLFVRNTDGYNAELLSNNLTTNRTFNFPDVGGTLALTTDITSSPWDTVTGGINYANGNVGIGTTAPSATLDVAGNIKTSGALTGPALFEIIAQYANRGRITLSASTSTNANQISLLTSGVPRMVVNKEGNVGIGTTSPDEKLEVIGGVTSKFYGFNAINDLTPSDSVYISAPRGSNLGLFTVSTERLTVDGSGNVGIGTTSPGEKLDVNGNIKLNQYGQSIYFGSTVNEIKGSASDFLYKSFSRAQWDNAGTYTDSSYVFKQSGSEVFRIHTGGNVGIGTTSPTKPLDVRTDIGVLIKGASGSSNAKISLVPASGGRQYDLGNSGSDFRIFDASAGITRMHFDNDGNTGIGTTTPSQKLEVDGQVLSDGYRLAAMQTAPATRNSAGTLGEIVIDGNHIYVCYATDSWSRVALETSW